MTIGYAQECLYSNYPIVIGILTNIKGYLSAIVVQVYVRRTTDIYFELYTTYNTNNIK